MENQEVKDTVAVTEQVVAQVKPPRKSPVAKAVQCIRCKRMRNSQAMRSTLNEDKTRSYTCRRTVTVKAEGQPDSVGCYIAPEKKAK